MYDIEQMLEDFAVVTYLKRNCYTQHEKQIKAEAFERIYDVGAELVKQEVVAREHVRLKQMLLNFEQMHGLDKTDE
jgi:uncharacterized protein YqgQ